MVRCGSSYAVGLDCALLGGCWLLRLSGALLTVLVLNFLSTNPLLLALLYPVASVAWAAVAALGFAADVRSIAIAAL